VSIEAFVQAKRLNLSEACCLVYWEMNINKKENIQRQIVLEGESGGGHFIGISRPICNTDSLHHGVCGKKQALSIQS